MAYNPESFWCLNCATDERNLHLYPLCLNCTRAKVEIPKQVTPYVEITNFIQSISRNPSALVVLLPPDGPSLT